VSLEVLIAELTRAAEQEAGRIRTSAVERASLIERTAQERARQRRDTELARLDSAQRLAVARDTAEAVRANRQALLQARSRLLEQVFARAAATLADMEAPGYRQGIPFLVQATLRYLEGTPSELHCRSDIASEVEAHCRNSTQVRVLPSADATAGLLGQSRDGRIVVDNTLPALLARRRSELAVEVARRLEEE
jgi:vacuolar-type H+-ATPase subunit E/Vma4